MAYVGPGDLVPGAACWYGMRAYNSAYAAPGSNPAIDVLRADGATATINILASGPNFTPPYSIVARAVRQQDDASGPEIFSLKGGGIGGGGNNGEALYFGDVANYAFAIGNTSADQINGNLPDGTCAALVAMFNVNGSPSQMWINGQGHGAAPLTFSYSTYGSGGTDGTYTDVPLHGGSGTGAVAATVQIVTGTVNYIGLATGYLLSPPAIDYAPADVLTMDAADIGGCAGASIELLTVSGTYTDTPALAPSLLKVGGVKNCHVAIAECGAWPFDITPYMQAFSAFTLSQS